MLDELQPEVLLGAYCQGIFPMGMDDGTVGWFAPNPRAIIPLPAYHVPRRLGRTFRQDTFELTIDRAFQAVMLGCADRPEGSWITPDFVSAYGGLHTLGFAHSVECWQGGELVGGVYGVSIAAAFYAESMFHRQRDASKVALVSLLDHVRGRGFLVFDVQFMTEHLRQFGAVEIPKSRFMKRLNEALNCENVSFV